MAAYRTIDLCAGIGGIRRGFELVRTEDGEQAFSNVLSSEIDKHACRTYEHLYHEVPLGDLSSREFLAVLQDPANAYDVLLAGFPCQAFSSAGLKRGFSDETRGTVFFHIKTIIEQTKPVAVFLENVENLVRHDQGRTLRTILRTLEIDLNYHVIGMDGTGTDGSLLFDWRSFVRNTADFGLPQHRRRTYLMAFSRERFGALVDDLPNRLPLRGDESIFVSVDDVLEPSVAPGYYLSSGYLETLKKHRQREKGKGNGFGYAVLNDESRTSRLANTIMATGGSGKERNLVKQPREDYVGLKLPRKKSPLNDEGIRMLTPLEWARLQGFAGYAFVDAEGVDHFSFPEDMPEFQRYKQLGNSVSIPVIKAMAEFMYACLMGVE